MAHQGCPAVIGLGIDENFAASDVAALLPVTRRFMFLEEGDVAEVRRRSVRILDAAGRPAVRSGPGKRFARRCGGARAVPPFHAQGNSRATPGDCANAGGKNCRREIVGCRLRTGAPKFSSASRPCTSRRAARVPRRRRRQLSHGTDRRLPARVEIASEYRYRDPVIAADTLFVTISQSGETADTLAALRNARWRRTWRRSPFATSPRARWSGNRTWCC